MAVIERVEVHEFEYRADGMAVDRNNNRVYAPGKTSTFSSFAVTLHCSDGIVGEYVCQFGGKRAHLGQVLMVAPMLVGRNPLEREAIYDDLKRALRQVGFLGVSAIDIALWDYAGKRVGLPVWQMLGGFRTRLPTYASSMHGDTNGGLASKEAYSELAEQCFGLGFRAFKMHGWSDGNATREAATVLHLAESVGARMKLMLDPACELRTFADALYVGRACDEGGFFWYEDPYRDGGVSQHAHRKLKQFLKTPLLVTEHIRGVESKADFITAGATDFVRADPEYDLGITGCMKIAHLAESFGLDVELHSVGPAQRHCMAAIRNTNFYEMVLVGPNGLRNPVPPVFACDYDDQPASVGSDGCYPVPDGPGLGVSYDWDFVTRSRTGHHVFGTRGGA
jgi:L-alanine-DL-glutamate epimerase-like enolase superfamily enzyme